MQTARRFVLGKQGLWPGRRWRGLEGTAQALREAERIQMDPLNIIARSHELALLSRVVDYAPEHLEAQLFAHRAFFDYGETLFLQPMAELPYWRAIMRRKRAEPHWADFAAAHTNLIEDVKRELRARGPLGHRDFDGNMRVSSYRARKDTGVALFYLWLTGELMTHHRVRFERVFDFAESIVPPAADFEASLEEAERFLVRKAIAFWGLCRARAFGSLLERKVSPAEVAAWVETLTAAGDIIPVEVEGQREPHYLLAADLPLLETVAAGGIPAAWRPLDTTTEEEVVFLAPLEIVSARGRAKTLFDFDYVWEVYKPVALRRWGYYTLPILHGDRLVARLDPKLDRKTGILHIQGFWLEEATSGGDPAFVEALARGLLRLARFVGAQQIEAAAIEPRSLRQHIAASASALSA